jgi:hypothetical protein
MYGASEDKSPGSYNGKRLSRRWSFVDWAPSFYYSPLQQFYTQIARRTAMRGTPAATTGKAFR